MNTCKHANMPTLIYVSLIIYFIDKDIIIFFSFLLVSLSFVWLYIWLVIGGYHAVLVIYTFMLTRWSCGKIFFSFCICENVLYYCYHFSEWIYHFIIFCCCYFGLLIPNIHLLWHNVQFSMPIATLRHYKKRKYSARISSNFFMTQKKKTCLLESNITAQMILGSWVYSTKSYGLWY